MTKLRLGTIGTSIITEQFIEAAIESGKYSLEAVYSRSEDKAQQFKDQFSAKKTYTDWDAFVDDSEIDVVYVASPNSLHFEQTKDILNHQKHAIVEKPIITSLEHFDQLVALAKEQGKMLVEAARHLYEPNFIKLTEMVESLPEVYGASITYSSYSSRYDNVLNGEEPNIFSPKFDGGAANDLGIYVVYVAVRWFGKPNSVHAFTQTIQTGADGKGTAILRYEDFDVTLNFSKINSTTQATEVYGPDHTLVLETIAGIEKAQLLDARTKTLEDVPLDPPADNPLFWEADAFADIMLNFDTAESKATLNEWWAVSKQAHEVLEEIRQQMK
jgi:predicted dehydrogenase